jgi:diguanylate cyclase (GGDEF)-like protein
MDQETGKPEDNSSVLQEKIDVIADEVLDILKQLSKDNKAKLNSKAIAERMAVKDNVKKMLIEPLSSIHGEHPDIRYESSREVNRLKDITSNFLDKFSDLAPDMLTEEISELKKQLHDKNLFENTASRLDSLLKYIKIYFDALYLRNKELEEFMRQTIRYLEETEEHVETELSLHQNKFNQDRDFEKSISINMSSIKEDFDSSPGLITDNLKNLKKAVFGKIESINKGIVKKRESDMLHLKEQEKTLAQSLRDQLTGLYNRKAYDQKVVETLANLRRYDVPASLLFCDIDYFKKINDSFGHKVGDLALIKLASLLKDKLRVNDFISRYGGEEFAIILPHTTLKDAINAGDGARSYIDNAMFSYKHKTISLKISIGISTFRKEDTVDSVMERADKALYLAKNSGRNTVKTEEDVIKEGDALGSKTHTS